MQVTRRTKCIFCNNVHLISILDKVQNIPQGLMMNDTNTDEAYWMPYNIQYCSECKTYQNEYLAELHTLYNYSHIAPIGNIRNTMDSKFAENISNNKNIKGILEIGAGKGNLSDIITENLESINGNYYIADPSYIGNTQNRIVINKYIEEVGVVWLREEVVCC